MSPSLSPVVLPSLSAVDLVDFLLQYHAAPTTAVVCFSRGAFLEELNHVINQHNEGENEHYDAHPLINPIIQQLAASRTVDLVFVPTLPHLRAYLATFDSRTQPYMHPVLQNANQRASMLVIYGLLELHNSTSELSAQGLSRTFAIAVEAAKMARLKLVVIEPSRVNSSEGSPHSSEADDRGATDPWKVQLALLNGSIRFGREDRAWAGRTIEAARVARRWCMFLEPSVITEGELLV